MNERLIIDGFVMDLLVELEESADSEATQFPVERGAPMTDHLIHKPRTLSLTFLVSDTPIGDLVELRAVGSVPSTEARVFLEGLRDSRRTFVVEYGDRRWEEQVFTSLTFAEDATEKTGGLFASAALQTVDLVDVRRVVVERVVVSSPRLPGRKMWLCPAGTPVSKSDAENKRNRCRQVVKEFDFYRFADGDRRALTDDEMNRMAAQTVNRLTGLGIPDDLEWNETTKQWERRGAPVTVTKHQFFENFLGVPPDYTPPATDVSDVPDRRETGRNI